MPSKKAFTLVELIVVITILAVLGTVAFVSFQDYVGNSRDSKRTTDIKNIEKALELSKLQTGVYPNPGTSTNITYSGATVWKQGEFNNDVVRVVRNFKEAPKDPLVDSFYGYSVTKNRGEYQLAGVLEDIDYGTSANGKLAGAYVKGNYNGKTVKVSTGSTTYVLAAPSILTSDLNETDLLKITQAQKLVYKGHKNLPASYTGTTYDVNGGFEFTPKSGTIVAYEGDLATVDNSTLVDNLQAIFTGSVIADEPDIEVIFSENKDLTADVVLGKKVTGKSYSSNNSSGQPSINEPSVSIVETDGNFNLLSNGTITCTNSTIGETGTLGGKIYTAVSNQNLSDKIGSNDIAYYESACTSLVSDMNLANSTSGGVFNALNGDANISHWDTSNVVDMSWLFRDSFFNSPIASWNTSSVINMKGTFNNASFFNQPIDSWDTSSVQDMSFMFGGIATLFNQPIGSWDTSNVQNMSHMFLRSKNFNQPLSSWNTSNVQNMEQMFYWASKFNQPLTFDTASVTTMKEMFLNTTSFNQSVVFDTKSVTNMYKMFQGASSFNQPLNFNSSSVTNMSGMFAYTSSFNQPLVLDTSSVTNMLTMFLGASSFNQPLNFDTSSVTNMEAMLNGTTIFNQDISNWCVSHISSIPNGFDGGSGLLGETAKQPVWGTCPSN